MEMVERRGPRPHRGAAIAVVLGALLLAAVANATGPGEPRAAPAERGVGIPTAEGGVAEWYCAEGTSAPGGRADETLYLTNVDARVARARVTVMAGAQGTKTVPVEVAARTTAPLRVADVLPAAEPGVLVESTGGRLVVDHGLAGNGDVAIGPCASAPSPRWTFAAGNTSRGSQQWLALFNASSDDAIVDVTFMTDTGPFAPDDLQGVVVPSRTRVSVAVHQAAPRRGLIATEVRARRGRVVAEQSLLLDGSDGRKGLAVSLGAPGFATRWVVPAALAGGGRSQQVIVANPGSNPVDATVLVHLDAAAEVAPQQVTVDPGSAVNVDLGVVPVGVGFSAQVRSATPVVVGTFAANTAPLPAAARGIASSVAETEPARAWVLAPARASTGSSDVAAVVNPGRHPVSLTAEILVGGQARPIASLTGTEVAPGSRVLLDLRALEVPPAAAVIVRASRPVVVGRESSSVPGFTLSAAVPERPPG